MDTNLLIFGFKRPDPKLVRFKKRFFKLLESGYEHLRVSIAFGVTKRSEILKNYLIGARHSLYAQGNTFEKTNKILRRLKKLVKQIYQQLSQFELLDKLADYEIHNVSPLSLFGLVRKCEPIVTSSAPKMIKRQSISS